MRITLLSLLLLLSLALACAVENQAFLGIFAETTVQKTAGMPDMTEMFKNMPAGVALPPGMVMPGMPQRLLTVRLWSPGIAAKNAFAKLAIPGGLKLGPTLNLDLYRPTAEKGTADGGGTVDPGAIPDFTLIRYWGSSATVKKGQPETIKFKDMIPTEQDVVREQANKTNEYFYKPNWTTGYWPTAEQPGAIEPEVSLTGHYALTTNYTGNVAIDVPDTVKFLNSIEFSSPKLDKQIDFTKPMVFRWKTIPGVLGYHASIIGMKGKNTLITWSSSEIKKIDSFGWDYLQMSQVRQLVAETAFMGPDRVEVTVPAGIFKECDSVMFMMVGYGTGAALAEGQPLPRVQTKTTISIMLGGKMMEDMAFDMDGMGDEE
ncbi:MAG: hypothetical protein ACYC6A_23090 [Armatimonadota bacterium]